MATQDGVAGEGGIDFNYGGAPNLQLTATVPAAYNFPTSGSSATGPGNIELAAKYRFLTQDNFGFDVAVFPRVILPSASPNVGDQHASYLLPIWIEKDWDKWSAFGGGGCEVNRGGGSQDFCLAGAVVTRQVSYQSTSRAGTVPSDAGYARRRSDHIGRRRRQIRSER